MKYLPYMLIAASTAVMAAQCERLHNEPYPYRQVPVAALVLPDTVNVDQTFDLIIRSRLSDCETNFQGNVDSQVQDTILISVVVKIPEKYVQCDTTRPFVESRLPCTFKTPGMRYFRAYGKTQLLEDSVYVK